MTESISIFHRPVRTLRTLNALLFPLYATIIFKRTYFSVSTKNYRDMKEVTSRYPSLKIFLQILIVVTTRCSARTSEPWTCVNWKGTKSSAATLAPKSKKKELVEFSRCEDYIHWTHIQLLLIKVTISASHYRKKSNSITIREKKKNNRLWPRCTKTEVFSFSRHRCIPFDFVSEIGGISTNFNPAEKGILGREMLDQFQ